MANLSVLPRPVESLQNEQTSAKKLEHTGPSENERVALALQTEQLAWEMKSPFSKGKSTDPSVQMTRS